eukprot:4102893-Pyramimonas_sp.AAC.1
MVSAFSQGRSFQQTCGQTYSSRAQADTWASGLFVRAPAGNGIWHHRFVFPAESQQDKPEALVRQNRSVHHYLLQQTFEYFDKVHGRPLIYTGLDGGLTFSPGDQVAGEYGIECSPASRAIRPALAAWGSQHILPQHGDLRR